MRRIRNFPGLRRPFRGVRRVMVVPCLRRPASRYRCLATAGLFDGTELHGTPARRGIPRRPSNQTFVAVPKLKKKHISSTTVSTKISSWPKKNSQRSCGAKTKSCQQERTVYVMEGKEPSAWLVGAVRNVLNFCLCCSSSSTLGSPTPDTSMVEDYDGPDAADQQTIFTNCLRSLVV